MGPEVGEQVLRLCVLSVSPSLSPSSLSVRLCSACAAPRTMHIRNARPVTIGGGGGDSRGRAELIRIRLQNTDVVCHEDISVIFSLLIIKKIKNNNYTAPFMQEM